MNRKDVIRRKSLTAKKTLPISLRKRGVDKVNIEWGLLSIAHNIAKVTAY